MSKLSRLERAAVTREETDWRGRLPAREYPDQRQPTHRNQPRDVRDEIISLCRLRFQLKIAFFPILHKHICIHVSVHSADTVSHRASMLVAFVRISLVESSC